MNAQDHPAAAFCLKAKFESEAAFARAAGSVQDEAGVAGLLQMGEQGVLRPIYGAYCSEVTATEVRGSQTISWTNV